MLSGGKINLQTCPVCGGSVTHKFVEDKAIWGKYSVKISGLEADVCDSCGEIYYNFDDALVMEKIAAALSQSKNQAIADEADAVLNLSETAKLLRISNQSVYNMIKDGRIKATKIGREWRFRKSEILTLMHVGENMPIAARNGREMSDHDKEILKNLQEEEE